MNVLASRLPATTPVVVLHHLGGDDEQVVETTADGLRSFDEADHLTSVWIEDLRTAGVAVEDLVVLTRTLRERCVWDQEQTHTSLLRHLLEESYEVIDAIEAFVADGSRDAAHVVEELGDLLFQVLFHSELGDEEGLFTLTEVADSVHAKLVARHPHVFADATIADSDDAARQWERLKLDEKRRGSVTEGVPLQLPALTLYTKLRRKASSVGVDSPSPEASRERAASALESIDVPASPAADTGVDADVDGAWSELVTAVVDLARHCGVDLESVLRRRSLALRAEILAHEAGNPSNSDD
jgi:tetrapyrrole methylase family protein/MazG family protein